MASRIRYRIRSHVQSPPLHDTAARTATTFWRFGTSSSNCSYKGKVAGKLSVNHEKQGQASSKIQDNDDDDDDNNNLPAHSNSQTETARRHATQKREFEVKFPIPLSSIHPYIKACAPHLLRSVSRKWRFDCPRFGRHNHKFWFGVLFLVACVSAVGCKCRQLDLHTVATI